MYKNSIINTFLLKWQSSQHSKKKTQNKQRTERNAFANKTLKKKNLDDSWKGEEGAGNVSAVKSVGAKSNRFCSTGLWNMADVETLGLFSVPVLTVSLTSAF